MLLFIDGFDHYQTSDLTRKWDSVTADDSDRSLSIGSSGRDGNGHFQISQLTTAAAGSSKSLDVSFADSTTHIVGFGFQFSEDWTTSYIRIGFYDSSDGAQNGVRINSSKQIEIVRDTSTVLATSTKVLRSGIWYFIEIEATASNSISDDEYIVRVNSEEWINLSATTDTQQQSTSEVTQVKIASDANHGVVMDFLFDDLYILDLTGVANNDFLGDVRVSPLLPNKNGSSSDFLGSDGNSTRNYQLVDDNPPDGDATYVEASGSADLDLYGMQNMAEIPAISGVHGVSILSLAKRTGNKVRGRMAIRTNSTDFVQGLFAPPSGSYEYFNDFWETNPDTSLQWTQSEIDSIEAGIKVREW